ncbi:hypothetical protein LPTSP4_18590 [Leptospira ryugenii]|uniref:Lipase helper protein n=1 Tax=Leptospira ryugenii TaxID=1917863 RepID=A0A2P2E0C2_9LEPT|nr:lipase secretion chaperone [Leptospira ryugenii]GBF50334.1 hypothetical protein LPTSP4_18590 [Leptospira ryugenii]
MKKSSLILITIAFVSILVILLGVSYMNPSRQESESEENPNEKAISYFQNQEDGFFVDPFYLESAKSIFTGEGGFLSYEEIISKAKSGELNLIFELWNLRRQCPEGSTREQCHEYIKAFLQNQYSAEEAKKLIQMLTNYLKYEEAMANIDTSSQSYTNQEMYDTIKQMRRKFFSKEEAELIFGLEEATAEFSYNRKNFLEETKNLKAEDRLKSYEEFRKKTFGQYYKAIAEREPKYDKFETEMELRRNELTKLSAQERDTKEKEIRIRYFGKEGNERIEKVLKDMKEEEERITKLEKEEANFLKNNPNLSASERDKKLLEMRTQALGSKELAEEYGRRLEYEKTLNKAQ